MNKITFTLIITLSTLLSSSLSAQNTREERKEAKEKKEASIARQVDSLIQSGTFTIEIDRILPSRGPAKNTNDGYLLKIEDNTLSTYLPYIGQATNLSYSAAANPAIEMNEAPVTIEIKKSQKDKYTLSFSSKTEESNERCDFTIDIFDNGSSSIYLTIVGRDPISYTGTITEINY